MYNLCCLIEQRFMFGVLISILKYNGDFSFEYAIHQVLLYRLVNMSNYPAYAYFYGMLIQKNSIIRLYNNIYADIYNYMHGCLFQLKFHNTLLQNNSVFLYAEVDIVKYSLYKRFVNKIKDLLL